MSKKIKRKTNTKIKLNHNIINRNTYKEHRISKGKRKNRRMDKPNRNNKNHE